MVTQIFIGLQEFKLFNLLVKLSIKFKRTEFFAVNNDMQKLGNYRIWMKGKILIP